MPIYVISSFFKEDIVTNPLILIYFVTGLAGVIGLWGYVYKKAIWLLIFWMIFSPFFIVLDIGVHLDWIQLYPEIPTNISVPFMLPMLAIMYYAPQYYALLKYAYKSESIWNGN